MTDFRKTHPLGTLAANLLDDDTRSNFVALEERLSKEHHFPDNPLGVRSGKHKFGVGNTAARDAAFPVPYAGAFWGFNTDVQSPQIHTGSAWFSITPPTTLIVGEIRICSDIAMVLPANGWYKCIGEELPIASFPALYAACGGAANWFGRPPFTVPSSGLLFRLPDLRQRLPVGYQATVPGYDPALGDNNQANLLAHTRALTLANLPAHSHPGSSVGGVTGVTNMATTGTGTSGRIRAGDASNIDTTANIPPHTHTLTIAPEGGPGTAVDIRDSYLVVRYMIWSGVP